MIAAISYVHAVTGAGIGLVSYALLLIAEKLWRWKPWAISRERTQVDDLRLVIDLAARLRDKDQHQAVAVCEQLTHELLKPSGTPVELFKP